MKIEISRENKNVNGFYIQKGFITLTENGEIIAVSSGWESYSCLMVYRPSDKGWVRKWENEDTFPVLEAKKMQEEFNKEELIRLDIAELISYFKAIPDIKEIAEEIVKEIEHITKSELEDGFVRIEHTSDLRKWELYCQGGEDYEIYNDETWHVYKWTAIKRGETSTGIQWCLVNYDDDSYCSSPSENFNILCVYVPDTYGTEDKELIEVIENFNLLN